MGLKDNHLYLYQQTFIPCAAETVGRPSIMSKDLRATLATLSIMRRLLAMIYGDLMRSRKKTWFGKIIDDIIISLKLEMITRRSTYAPLRSSDLKQCLAQSPSQSLHQEHYKPEKKHRKSVKLSWHHNFGKSCGRTWSWSGSWSWVWTGHGVCLVEMHAFVISTDRVDCGHSLPHCFHLHHGLLAHL